MFVIKGNIMKRPVFKIQFIPHKKYIVSITKIDQLKLSGETEGKQVKLSP
jgi:hypothetical protein